MSNITPVTPEQATGETKDIYNSLESKMGKVINIFQIMGNSPAVLNSYLEFSGAIKQGSLSHQDIERIAVLAGTLNNCDYCISAHTAIGKSVKVSDQELENAQSAQSENPESQALLQFAKAVVEKRGWVSEEDIENVKKSGFTDTQITEVIAVVSLNIFTNYINHAAGTEIDFPKVEIKTLQTS